MNAKKLYRILLAVIGLLVAGGSLALYTSNSILKEKATRVADLRAEESFLEAQEASYVKSGQDLKKYQAIKDVVDKIIPKNKDQALAVAELFAIAEESQIKIANITFPSSDLGKELPKPKVTETKDGETKTEEVAAPPPVTQGESISGIPGVYGIVTNVAFVSTDATAPITYEKILTFLKKLELNRRTMQMTQVDITPLAPTVGSPFEFNITVTIFVKP